MTKYIIVIITIEKEVVWFCITLLVMNKHFILTTQPLYSVTGHKLGPLIANYHSVILMGAGLPVDDLWFESALYQYQLTK